MDGGKNFLNFFGADGERVCVGLPSTPYRSTKVVTLCTGMKKGWGFFGQLRTILLWPGGSLIDGREKCVRLRFCCRNLRVCEDFVVVSAIFNCEDAYVDFRGWAAVGN